MLTKHLADDKEAATYNFRGVETGQATLTISAHDVDIPLGSSTHDLGPITKFDAMDTKEEYVTELDVDIEPDGGGDAVCKVVLRICYIPSKKDRREELYEVLNKTTQRKAQAVEKLRRAAVSAARSGPSSPSAMTTRSAASPAVKSGFLNKKKEPSKIMAFYDKHLGPNSILRRVMPIAKNYVIFFTFATFMHFKGQLLSLPPPV